MSECVRACVEAHDSILRAAFKEGRLTVDAKLEKSSESKLNTSQSLFDRLLDFAELLRPNYPPHTA